jgi:hypothetical protein
MLGAGAFKKRLDALFSGIGDILVAEIRTVPLCVNPRYHRGIVSVPLGDGDDSSPGQTDNSCLNTYGTSPMAATVATSLPFRCR